MQYSEKFQGKSLFAG